MPHRAMVWEALKSTPKTVKEEAVVKAPGPINQKCLIEINVGKTTYREASAFGSIKGYWDPMDLGCWM